VNIARYRPDYEDIKNVYGEKQRVVLSQNCVSKWRLKSLTLQCRYTWWKWTIIESKSPVKVRMAICHGSCWKQLEHYWKQKTDWEKQPENTWKTTWKTFRKQPKKQQLEQFQLLVFVVLNYLKRQDTKTGDQDVNKL